METIVPCKGLKCVQVLVDEEKIKSLTLSQQMQLISSQKPTPQMCITWTCESYTKKFSRAPYKIPWIVGCSHTNKFYCWPCIFFLKSKNVWNTSGFDDLSNLSRAIKKHSRFIKHLNAVIDFSSFCKQHTKTLPRYLSDQIAKYNSRVDSNRSVFRRLIDIVCHLAQQELPFNDEESKTLNEGNFFELVSLLSRYDVVLKNHLPHGQSHNMGLISNKIQNGIINSIADVIKDRIDFEVKGAKFVSIIIDETLDEQHRERLCLILRYFFGKQVHDRFYSFIDVAENSTADSLFNILFEFLNKYECIPKLIAQSYDCASVLSDVRNEVQQRIKNVCPQAIYTWCNAHTLESVLYKSCNRIGEVSLFFSGLEALCSFFNHSTKRAALYDKYCSKKLPNEPATLWLYMSVVVSTVAEQRSKLIILFSDLCGNPQKWDGDTIFAAENFKNILHSFNFNFFLAIFLRIFEKTVILYNILQESKVYVGNCNTKIKEFQSWLLNEFISEFDEIYQTTLQNNSAPRLRRNVSCSLTEYRRLFVQVIDNIYSEITDRYSEMYKLQFLELFNNKKFEQYNEEFPTEAFNSLFYIYSDYFNKLALKTQLTCLYSNSELKDRNVYKIIEFINENKLEYAFPELLKLACLIVTIPATTSSTEPAFFSHVHIHTCLRNTQAQEGLIALPMLAIEKELLVELKRSPTFYSDVIKSFVKKETRFELEYK